MLSARRDPIFDHGAHDAPSSPNTGQAGGHASSLAAVRPTGFARFIAGLQIVGTVLAVPLGLASGYSIYRTNFSPEASCGSLRANIIAMLDKNADASTLRLLVRRDVASFERSCAAVDPDAVAAFKALLAKPATSAAVKEAKPAKAEKQVARPTPAERAMRPESAKRVAADAASADTRRARTDPDADWLAAVRRALVERAPVTRAQAAESPMPLASPAVQPNVQPMGKPLLAPAQAQPVPPLPSAAAEAGTPAPETDEAHPVPPALIPNVGPAPAR